MKAQAVRERMLFQGFFITGWNSFLPNQRQERINTSFLVLLGSRTEMMLVHCRCNKTLWTGWRLNNRNLALTVLVPETSKNKLPVHMTSGKGLIPVFTCTKEQRSSQDPFHKGISLLQNSLNLMTKPLQRAKLSHLELDSNILIWGAWHSVRCSGPSIDRAEQDTILVTESQNHFLF